MRSEPVELTLIRHGESTFNAAGLYQGASDQPVLTTTGKAQAAAAVALLSGRYDQFWSSPLSRAHETAKILADQFTCPPLQLLSDLKEIDLPEWEAQAFAEIKRDQKARHRVWKFTPSQFVMAAKDGTPHHPARDVLARAETILNRARALPPGQRVLAVTHGGMIRALLVAALGMAPDHIHAAVLDNCSSTRLALWPDKTVELRAFNEPHQQPGLEALSEIARQRPVIFLTATPLCHALGGLAPQQVSLSNRDARAELLSGAHGSILAHGTEPELLETLQYVLDSSDGNGATLGLAPKTVHIIQAANPTNPAALWHMNLPLTATASVPSPARTTEEAL